MTEYRSSAYKDAETHPTGNRRQRAAACIRGLFRRVSGRDTEQEASLTPETPKEVGAAFKLLVNRTLVDGFPQAKGKNIDLRRRGQATGANGDLYNVSVAQTRYGATEVCITPNSPNRTGTTSTTFVGPNTAEPYVVSRPTNPYDKVPNRGIVDPEYFGKLQMLLDRTEWSDDPNAAGASQATGAQHTYHSPYANMR